MDILQKVVARLRNHSKSVTQHDQTEDSSQPIKLPENVVDLASLIAERKGKDQVPPWKHTAPVETVDIGSLAERLGVTIEYEPLESGTRSKWRKDGDTWVLVVSKELEEARKKFIIAHELAEVVLKGK